MMVLNLISTMNHYTLNRRGTNRPHRISLNNSLQTLIINNRTPQYRISTNMTNPTRIRNPGLLNIIRIRTNTLLLVVRINRRLRLSSHLMTTPIRNLPAPSTLNISIRIYILRHSLRSANVFNTTNSLRISLRISINNSDIRTSTIETRRNKRRTTRRRRIKPLTMIATCPRRYRLNNSPNPTDSLQFLTRSSTPVYSQEYSTTSSPQAPDVQESRGAHNRTTAHYPTTSIRDLSFTNIKGTHGEDQPPSTYSVPTSHTVYHDSTARPPSA